jgi:carotenoid 1,2-hydratase
MRGKYIQGFGTLRPQHSQRSASEPRDDATGFRTSVSGDGRSDLRARLARLDGFVSAAGVAQQNSAPLPGGREHPPGARSSDGRSVGAPGGGEPCCGSRFDATVPPHGYAWWYVDAISDDKRQGVSIIALLGSVFSPYYAWSGRRDPLNHCALNVAIYGERSRRWAMTERGRDAVHRDAQRLAIGPSALNWDRDVLTITIDEVTAPIPSKIRGVVRVFPRFLSVLDFRLDQNGDHLWRPIAPSARVEVELTRPAVKWSGNGYLDANCGAGPLEDNFVHWHWSRVTVGDGAAILYDVARREGEALNLALRFDPSGAAQNFQPPPTVKLAPTSWRIARTTRSEPTSGAPAAAAVLRTLEDAPFYARSLVSTRLFGDAVISMHETLSLDRFALRWVKSLLPFKMPRAF